MVAISPTISHVTLVNYFIDRVKKKKEIQISSFTGQTLSYGRMRMENYRKSQRMHS